MFDFDLYILDWKNRAPIPGFARPVYSRADIQTMFLLYRYLGEFGFAEQLACFIIDSTKFKKSLYKDSEKLELRKFKKPNWNNNSGLSISDGETDSESYFGK